MTITISRVNKLKDGKEGTTLKAMADIVIDGKIIIRGVRVIDIKGTLYVKLPDKNVNNEWKPIVEFTDIELSTELTTKVLDAYNKLL